MGFVAGLVLLEGGLRIAALTVGPRALQADGAGGRRTILCLGDSHTYGVFYPAADAYPGQLQSVLDSRTPGRYRVLNLGLPGMNSSEIAARLTAWLDQYQPYAVVVACGINNFWNRSDVDWPSEAPPPWYTRLRLYRFYRLLALRFHPPPKLENTARPDFLRTLKDEGRSGEAYRDPRTNQLLIEHHGSIGGELRPTDEVTALQRRDLEAIHAMASERGVRLVLLTYGAFPLPGRPENQTGLYNEQMNEIVRDVSRERGVTLVDPHDRFAALLPGATPRAHLFFNEFDDHPNPRGYREVALAVAEAFEPEATPRSE
jgi:lysophospholipase L1-like esterase